MVDTSTTLASEDISAPPTMTPPPLLPTLTQTPRLYSGCCLALSAPLITHLRSLLPPPPQLTLSVGSGFGLLEALLLTSSPTPLHITGVEVDPSPNMYLPPSNHRTVYGTRFLEPLAGEAATWLFVYPRRVGLVNEYLAKYGEWSVKQIIWIGPRADWEDYTDCFLGWHTNAQGADEVGGRAWEMIAIASKTLG
jgi:hypothetical protein